jgi:hypothetical protein
LFIRCRASRACSTGSTVRSVLEGTVKTTIEKCDQCGTGLPAKTWSLHVVHDADGVPHVAIARRRVEDPLAVFCSSECLRQWAEDVLACIEGRRVVT